jgi:hypothetical protein
MIPRQNLAPHLLNRMRSAGRGAGTVQYRPIAGLSTASLPRARSHAASTPGDTHPRLHTHRSSGGCRGRGATWWRGWRYGTSGMTRRGAAEVASCGKSAGRRKSSCKCLAYGEGGQVRISMRRTWVERADEWNLASRGAGQRNGVGAVVRAARAYGVPSRSTDALLEESARSRRVGLGAGIGHRPRGSRERWTGG